MMSYLAEAYKRWRHGHGFGVHSPFAYFMVKEVVRPATGYDYYGYACIDEAWLAMSRPERHKAMRRQARILLRLAARLDLRSAFLPKAEISIPFRAALDSACSQMQIHTAQADIHLCDLVLTAGDFISAWTLAEFLSQDHKVLGMRNAPQGWADILFRALPHGLMLHDGDSFIIVNRPHMHKAAYTIRL